MDFIRWCIGVEEHKDGSFMETDNCQAEPSSSINTRNLKRIESFEDQIARVNRAGREQITSRPIDLEENFEPPSFPKTEHQRKFLREILKHNFIFKGLNEEEMEQLVSAMQHEHAPQGKLVIRQGDVGDFFYVVETGKVEYLLNDKSVGFATPGQGFGELALLYDAPRAVSCKAVEATSLWKVDQKTFRTLLARQSKSSDDELKHLIDKIKLFTHLDQNDKARFINAMTTVVWNPDDRIVQKGSVGNVFYIIQEGKVKVHDIGGDSAFDDLTLGPGDFFGERALLTGELRAANVTALTEVKTLAMDRETFEKAIGPLQGFLDMEMRKHFLQSIPIFSDSNLHEQELDQLARLMDEVCYRKGEMLAIAGQPNEMFLWVIRHGSLKVSDKDATDIHILVSGDYFGDRVIAGDPKAVGYLNAIVQEPITTWVLRRDDVASVIGDVGRLGSARVEEVEEETIIPFNELQRLTILGRGGFGTVWLTRHGDEAYALKEISKRQLLEADQVRGVMREKEMLATLRHPFILRSVSAYQDDKKLYILLPIIPGGELFNVVQSQKMRHQGLKNYNVAFYAAGILEALGYFHQRLIAYRDLKLENVLIDADGYPVIVDLGFAKKVVDKTYTLCGTPEYLAPEIIMSKGHDKAADYWSYGVLVYELFVGVTPFYRPHATQLDMFKRIASGQFTMPSYIDPLAAKLIRNGLLVRKPAERLGNLSRGYLDIKASDWFTKSGVSWGALMQKRQRAPWKPKIKNAFDASNFDTMHEEYVYEEPLTTEEQALFAAFA